METTTIPSERVRGRDALELLSQDHREVDALYAQLEASTDLDARIALMLQICDALTLHAQIEEELFYPALRSAGVSSNLLDRARHEHGDVKRLVAEIWAQRDHEGGDSHTALAQMMRAVSRHVEEEESQLFPLARECGLDLTGIGAQLAERKQLMQGRAPGTSPLDGPPR